LGISQHTKQEFTEEEEEQEEEVFLFKRNSAVKQVLYVEFLSFMLFCQYEKIH
jgi:hypothetical protein